MRKVLYDRFGTPAVLRIAEVPEPTPGTDEILVAVRAAALNPKDILVRKGKFRWLSGKRFPRGTGYDWAGEVLALGPEVMGVAVGDLCFGMLNGWAGGSLAERVIARADECARMPAGLSFEQAAAIPLAAQTAWQALRNLGKLAPGQRVACLGASGGVGLFAVQLARALGAEVTASASAGNLPLLTEAGAHHTVDYATQDVLAGGPYDLVLDVFGNRHFEEAEPALSPNGIFVSTVPSLAILAASARTLLRGKRARLVVVRSRSADLEALSALAEAGALRPIIDSTFDLTDVAAAHARIETKHTRGKVVVRVPSARTLA